MKLATNYRKKGASLALCKIHNNRTTGCLAKVHSTSDPMKNIKIHPQKTNKQNQQSWPEVITVFTLDIRTSVATSSETKQILTVGRTVGWPSGSLTSNFQFSVLSTFLLKSPFFMKNKIAFRIL